MREYTFSINDQDNNRSLALGFNTGDGNTLLTLRVYKTLANGQVESTSMGIDSDDAQAMMDFLQMFLAET